MYFIRTQLIIILLSISVQKIRRFQYHFIFFDLCLHSTVHTRWGWQPWKVYTLAILVYYIECALYTVPIYVATHLARKQRNYYLTSFEAYSLLIHTQLSHNHSHSQEEVCVGWPCGQAGTVKRCRYRCQLPVTRYL